MFVRPSRRRSTGLPLLWFEIAGPVPFRFIRVQLRTLPLRPCFLGYIHNEPQEKDHRTFFADSPTSQLLHIRVGICQLEAQASP